MASFGEELRRERELRDISLREISEATKISIRFLEGLEQNNFDLLPGGVFNRGFVRAYARFIGVDAEEMVNAYLHEVSLREARKGHGDEAPAGKRGAARGSQGGEAAQTPGVFRPETRPLGGTEGRAEPRRAPEREFVPTLSRVERPSPPPEAAGRGSMALWVLAALVFAVAAGVIAISLIPSREAGGSPERLSQAREARLSQKAGGARPGPVVETGAENSAAQAPAAAASSPQAGALDSPTESPASSTSLVQPVGASVPADPNAPPPPIEHMVRVRALEATRVQIECGGKLLLDQELWPNQMKSVACVEPVLVSADNAGAVLIALDSGADALLGGSGERVEGRQIAPALVPEAVAEPPRRRPAAPAPSVPPVERPEPVENGGD